MKNGRDPRPKQFWDPLILKTRADPTLEVIEGEEEEEEAVEPAPLPSSAAELTNAPGSNYVYINTPVPNIHVTDTAINPCCTYYNNTILNMQSWTNY